LNQSIEKASKEKQQMKINQISFAVVATIAMSAASLHAASSDAGSTTNSTDAMTALFGDPVVATGTGVQVKRSDLDTDLTAVKSEYAAQGRQLPPEALTQYEAQILMQLIDVQLLMQNATAADKAEGSKKVDAAMDSLRQRAGSQETLDMQLRAAGTTEKQFRDRIGQQATALAVEQRVLGPNVTASEIQKFYEDHSADFEQPETVHVRHILFMTIDPTTRAPLSDDAVQAKRKQADDVLKRARAGEDFSKLAQQYSEDPTTKEKGGDLPPFSHGQMVPEFDEAAFSLTNNQISDVVKTVYGYHIIKMVGKTPAKKLALTDVVPPSNETISDKIKNYLIQKNFAPAYLEKLNKAANVKIVDQDLNAAVESLLTQSKTNALPVGK